MYVTAVFDGGGGSGCDVDVIDVQFNGLIANCMTYKALFRLRFDDSEEISVLFHFGELVCAQTQTLDRLVHDGAFMVARRKIACLLPTCWCTDCINANMICICTRRKSGQRTWAVLYRMDIDRVFGIMQRNLIFVKVVWPATNITKRYVFMFDELECSRACYWENDLERTKKKT